MRCASRRSEASEGLGRGPNSSFRVMNNLLLAAALTASLVSLQVAEVNAVEFTPVSPLTTGFGLISVVTVGPEDIDAQSTADACVYAGDLLPG